MKGKRERKKTEEEKENSFILWYDQYPQERLPTTTITTITTTKTTNTTNLPQHPPAAMVPLYPKGGLKKKRRELRKERGEQFFGDGMEGESSEEEGGEEKGEGKGEEEGEEKEEEKGEEKKREFCSVKRTDGEGVFEFSSWGEW